MVRVTRTTLSLYSERPDVDVALCSRAGVRTHRSITFAALSSWQSVSTFASNVLATHRTAPPFIPSTSHMKRGQNHGTCTD